MKRHSFDEDHHEIDSIKLANARRFSSFQARRPPGSHTHEGEMGPALCGKPKVHGCSICGVEFAIGQALGGHMRRHREKSVGNKAGLFGLKKTVGNKAGSFDLNFPPLDEKLERRLGLGLGLGLGLEHVC
ncbi:uncharacterized protein A4U43_C07F2760 [Asparagus officinalis]|uniref:C2H2-type domain-containing protein n=1 Tax=Asparagus officinalis TaxID=4686 RepID=A0A5P1E8Z4_ASPOF|nr:uncharacterized protein A4U43_C07F2760 [Asparagus officinalis]